MLYKVLVIDLLFCFSIIAGCGRENSVEETNVDVCLYENRYPVELQAGWGSLGCGYSSEEFDGRRYRLLP